MASVVVVGASRGLGRAFVEEHLKRGWDVVATVREPPALAELRDLDCLWIEVLETSDWHGIDSLNANLRQYAPVDMLLVNAGIAADDLPIGDVTPEGFTQLMLVNALAPLRIIDCWLPLTAPSATIAVMCSEVASMALSAGRWEAYRMSKSALNMGFRSLAQRHADARTYLSIAPGWVRTDLGGPDAMLSLDDSILPMAYMLERRRGSGGFAYVDYKDDELPW